MGFDRGTLPADRNRPERAPWTSWAVLIVIVIAVVVGLFIFI